MTYSEFLSRESETLRKNIRVLLGGFSDTAQVSVIKVKEGENILSQGEPRSDIFVLISGRASTVFQHWGYTTYAFDEFTPISIFGEQEALSGHAHIVADVRAKSNCRFLALREADYLRWVQSDTGIMQKRMRAVINTLFRQVEQERSALFLTRRQRVQQFLMDYYQRHVDKFPSGVVVVRQNRVSIAEETGISLRTVNRIVQRMYDNGDVTPQKGKITLSQEQFEQMKNNYHN